MSWYFNTIVSKNFAAKYGPRLFVKTKEIGKDTLRMVGLGMRSYYWIDLCVLVAQQLLQEQRKTTVSVRRKGTDGIQWRCSVPSHHEHGDRKKARPTRTRTRAADHAAPSRVPCGSGRSLASLAAACGPWTRSSCTWTWARGVGRVTRGTACAGVRARVYGMSWCRKRCE